MPAVPDVVPQPLVPSPRGSSTAAMPLDRDSPVYVAGHRGLVGSAVWRHLEQEGFTNLVGASSAELDLRDSAATTDFFETHRPRVVIDAAARVGGILANSTYPAEFLSDNLRIQVNLMDAAAAVDVPRLLFLGSACVYPKITPQPITESSLLTAAFEPTNDAYAIAKVAGIFQVQAHRRQFGRKWISAMPTNLYGPQDNFHLANSHVLPALVRRIHEAKASGAPQVVLWGTGTPRREFLHADDLASASLFLLEHYDAPEPINVGVGSDLAIRELAELICRVVGYEGELITDPSMPDGTPRRLLDVSRLTELGWQPSISLEDGLTATYAWFCENQGALRG